MSEVKNTNLDTTEETAVAEPVKSEKELRKEAKAQAKADKLAEKEAQKQAQAEAEARAEKQRNKKNQNKKPNIFVRMGRKMKEIFSELKKVSWPKFGKVVKNTGVVLAVVTIFLVFITACDFGLSNLFKLLVK